MSKLTKLVTIVASAGLMAGGGVLYAQSTGGGAQGTDSGNATGGRGDSGSTVANDPTRQRADGVNNANSNTTANGSANTMGSNNMGSNNMGSNNSTANDSSMNSSGSTTTGVPSTSPMTDRNSTAGSTAGNANGTYNSSGTSTGSDSTTAPSSSSDGAMPAPRADRN